MPVQGSSRVCMTSMVVNVLQACVPFAIIVMKSKESHQKERIRKMVVTPYVVRSTTSLAIDVMSMLAEFAVFVETVINILIRGVLFPSSAVWTTISVLAVHHKLLNMSLALILAIMTADVIPLIAYILASDQSYITLVEVGIYLFMITIFAKIVHAIILSFMEAIFRRGGLFFEVRSGNVLHRLECVDSLKKNIFQCNGIWQSLHVISMFKKTFLPLDDDNDDPALFNSVMASKEECALCFIPFPANMNETSYFACCGKSICDGCTWKLELVLNATNAERALKNPPEPPLLHNCPFCRACQEVDEKVHNGRLISRMALNDPIALNEMAYQYAKGEGGVERNKKKEFDLYLQSAEIGSATACVNLSVMYKRGVGVKMDSRKRLHYLKLAAQRGHIKARNFLGWFEWERKRYRVAVKHWIISASAGLRDSTTNMKMAYRKNHATKEEFEMALRAYQKSKDEETSENREQVKATGLFI